MRAERWTDVGRVLAIRLDNVGDMVLMSPALRAMRAAMPGASITLMASPAGTQVTPMLPWVDDVMTHSVSWQDVSARMPLDPAREQALVADIAQRQFDAAFIFTSFSQSPWPAAYACYLAGVPVRIGQSKEFGGSLLTHAVRPPSDTTHQAERNVHLLEWVGIAASDRNLELRIPPDAGRRARELLARHGVGDRERFVVVSPGASCAARRYDARRFAEVVRLLDSRTGLRIVIVGSDRERTLVDFVGTESGAKPVVIGGETTISELAAVVDRAGLLIANDSGPMHIADAVGCPMVILYSGTEYESQWSPRASSTALLRKPTACSPCYAFTCPYEMECLNIAPGDVVAHALRLLDLEGVARSREAALA